MIYAQKGFEPGQEYELNVSNRNIFGDMVLIRFKIVRVSGESFR